MLRFEVIWGDDKKTPPFKLEVGAIGAIDMDALKDIQEGADCRIIAWQEDTGLAYSPEKTILYNKGRGVAGTVRFVYKRFEYAGGMNSTAA
jgi:hypothetical protein